MHFSLRKVFYQLPPAWRFWARRIWFWPQDVWAAFSKKRNNLRPPKGMIFTGSGDFEKDGAAMVGHFVQLAGLRSDSRILDIGSGIGRIALPLTRILDEKGHYEGFDVVETGVRWCQTHISAQFPQFHFRHIPLKNDLYTAAGSDAAQFSFPFEAENFDFACSISVFTHMLPEEVARYFDELHRTLRPGGRVFATFFLLNEQNRFDSNPAFLFSHSFGHYALMDEKVKAGNVAFAESWLLENAIGLRRFAVEGKFYGFWSGRPKAECINFQDMVVLRKI